MATVNDLLIVQSHVIQLLASDRSQPTVSEVAEQAEAGTLIPFLIELAQARGVDASILAHAYVDTDRGRSVSDTLASAANVIDTQRKYGMPYDDAVGLLALLWYIIDSIPAPAQDIELGF